MTSDEADFVKGLIESITNNIQGPLLNEWKVIEEFIINDEESHGDKAGIDDIKRFAKYKSIIANLEQAIQTFEMVLKKVHEKHRDVSFGKGFYFLILLDFMYLIYQTGSSHVY